MRSRMACVMAMIIMIISLAACRGSGGSNEKEKAQQDAVVEETTAEETPGDSANQESASNQASQNEDSASNTASTGGGIDVDKGLLNVEINISAESAEFYGITFESQEEADAYAKEQGFKTTQKTNPKRATIGKKSEADPTRRGCSRTRTISNTSPMKMSRR